jgi:hypothetical protein
MIGEAHAQTKLLCQLCSYTDTERLLFSAVEITASMAMSTKKMFIKE